MESGYCPESEINPQSVGFSNFFACVKAKGQYVSVTLDTSYHTQTTFPGPKVFYFLLQ